MDRIKNFCSEPRLGLEELKEGESENQSYFVLQILKLNIWSYNTPGKISLTRFDRNWLLIKNITSHIEIIGYFDIYIKYELVLRSFENLDILAVSLKGNGLQSRTSQLDHIEPSHEIWQSVKAITLLISL